MLINNSMKQIYVYICIVKSNYSFILVSYTQEYILLQFDLEASAFPPLPGLEDPGHSTANNTSTSMIMHRSDTTVVSVLHQTTEPIVNESTIAHEQITQGSNHWGENRLADVVKGTARPKSSKVIKISKYVIFRTNFI